MRLKKTRKIRKVLKAARLAAFAKFQWLFTNDEWRAFLRDRVLSVPQVGEPLKKKSQCGEFLLSFDGGLRQGGEMAWMKIGVPVGARDECIEQARGWADLAFDMLEPFYKARSRFLVVEEDPSGRPLRVLYEP